MSPLISPQSPTHGVRLSKSVSVIYEIARLSVSSQTFSIARKNGRFENFSGQVDIAMLGCNGYLDGRQSSFQEKYLNKKIRFDLKKVSSSICQWRPTILPAIGGFRE
ncbi:hypothetical protein [Brucella intermedia]|uniref:hypothetical protein n=1 Tax=Brucella intermedia TaxID=94625 RepID=UPI0013B02571|nr:hypothetical protein [Brucella intermedia]